MTLTGRHFHYIKPEEVDHATRSVVKTVPGTRATHCFFFQPNSMVIHKREYSCFCSSCIIDPLRISGVPCLNEHRVKPLAEFDLTRVASQGTANSWDDITLPSDDEEDDVLQSLIESLHRPRTTSGLPGSTDEACHFIVEKSSQDDFDEYDYYVCLVRQPLVNLDRDTTDDYGNDFSIGTPVVDAWYYDLVEGYTSADPLYTLNKKRVLIRPSCIRITHFPMSRASNGTFMLSREVHERALHALNHYNM